jgi:hypothetical protein
MSDGRIEELVVFDRALTWTEVQHLARGATEDEWHSIMQSGGVVYFDGKEVTKTKDG